MSNQRTYALVVDSQEELQRFIGLRGIISDAEGMSGIRNLDTLQAQGNFKIYGELEEDSFGKKRSGTNIAEAIKYVTTHRNSVLGVTSIEQISNNIQTIVEILQDIHAAGSGIVIRFSSRGLELKFSQSGEYNGWIWIGQALADFIEQVKIAAYFDEMFHPSAWAKIPNSKMYQVWDQISAEKSNAAVSRATGISEKTVAKLRRRFKNLETIYRNR